MCFTENAVCRLSLRLQEIPLSEILTLEPAQNFSLLPEGASPHCFEITTASLVYFVGENLLRGDTSVSGSTILVSLDIPVMILALWFF